jgi:hypothetical protein
MRIVFDLGSICKREFEQKQRHIMRDFIQELAPSGNSTYSLRREAASFNKITGANSRPASPFRGGVAVPERVVSAGVAVGRLTLSSPLR